MDRSALEKILAYIDSHIHEKINLSELSDVAGYSPFYFSRLFSEAMGMPVTGYIRVRKLQHAVVSLLEGQKVLDVALLYAFDSHEGFTRAFTQLFGMAPSVLRRRLASYSVPEYVVPANIKGGFLVEEKNSSDLRQNMHRLAFEFLEQSLGEAREGFCTEIIIGLLPENKVKISDNGRGLPLSGDLQADEAALDKILAGGPITGAEYCRVGDLKQPGLQTVNSLCEALRITVYRDGSQSTQDYIRGVAQHDLHVSASERPGGTEVVLKPDAAIFGETKFSEEILCAWIKDKSAGIDNLKIEVYNALY